MPASDLSLPSARLARYENTIWRVSEQGKAKLAGQPWGSAVAQDYPFGWSDWSPRVVLIGYSSKASNFVTNNGDSVS